MKSYIGNNNGSAGFQPGPAMMGGFSSEGHGFESESGLKGFQAAGQAWGFSPEGGSAQEDFLDEEEKERVEAVERANEERKRALFQKQEAEEGLKRDRKAKGREDLQRWGDDRKKQLDLRRKQNAEGEKAYHEGVQKQRDGPNPWERVVANCEMNGSQYVGAADVSRMRQAMQARKADITKGVAKKTMF